MKKLVFIIFVVILSSVYLSAEMKTISPDNVIDHSQILSSEQSSNYYSSRDSVLSYHDVEVYYWECPDTYGDTEFGMRFTAPYDCDLTQFNICFYPGGSYGTPDITIHVYDDNGSDLPGTELGSVSVPYANILWYPAWTMVDLTNIRTPLQFSAGEDFFITYSVDGGVQGVNGISCISDDGFSGHNRSVEKWGGFWGSMFDGWGMDVDFLMQAVVSEPVFLVGGTIYQDTTWCADTIYVESNVIIPDTVTVTICPGTTVEFQGDYNIWVEGSLIADGTAEEMITFTAEDTAVFWGAIRFRTYYPRRASVSSLLDYCILEYSDYYEGGAISNREYDNLTISNSIIRHCDAEFGGGISLEDVDSVYIYNNEIYDCTAEDGGGIAIEYDESEYQRDELTVIIDSNYIHHNYADISGGGVYIEDETPYYAYYPYRSSTDVSITNNTISYNETKAYPWDWHGGGYRGMARLEFYEENSIKLTPREIRFLQKQDEFDSDPDRDLTPDDHITSIEGYGGGGIYVEFDDITIDGNTITDNICYAWLGFFDFYNAYDDRELSNNPVFGAGAGVFLQGLAFEEGSPHTDRGLPPYYPVLDNNTIDHNQILIYVDAYQSFNDHRDFWDYNAFGYHPGYATALGAGIFSVDTFLEMDNNSITGNTIELYDYGTWEHRNDMHTLQEMVKNIDPDSRDSNDFPPIGFGGGICQIVTLIMDSVYTDTLTTFKMSNTTVDSNQAFWGSGLALLGDNISKLTNNDIDNNSSNLVFELEEMIGRDTVQYNAGIGGGIFNEGILDISGGSISGNTAGMGGGIFNSYYYPYGIVRDDLVPLRISRTDINHNTAQGAYIYDYFYYNDHFLDSVQVSIRMGAGGGILVKQWVDSWHWSPWEILFYALYYNDLTDFGLLREGPRVHGTIELDDCMFNGNSSVTDGGAFHVSWDSYIDLIINDCIFNENTSERGYGGAVSVPDIGDFQILNSSFTGNSADDGGALYLSTYMEDEYFDRDFDRSDIINCLFADNSAYYGGGIYLENYLDYYWDRQSIRDELNINIINSTIANNTAFEEGGGIYLEDYHEEDDYRNTRTHSSLSLLNSILWGNVADSVSNQIFVQETVEWDYRYLDSLLVIDYCDIEDGFDGIDYSYDEVGRYYSIINIYPEFVNASIGDYSLLSHSPCINTGVPDTSGYNIPALDLAGNDRIYGGEIERIDLGAFEFQGEPEIVDPYIIYIEGVIEEDVELCADTVYVIEDVIIPADVTVTICPGTTVMFVEPDLVEFDFGGPYRDEAPGIYCYGSLIADGTPEDSIKFTVENPWDNWWTGINFFPDSMMFIPRAASIFDNCIFEYSYEAPIYAFNYPELEVSNSIFRYNNGYVGGAIFIGGMSNAYIHHNEFYENVADYGGAIAVGTFETDTEIIPEFRTREDYLVRIMQNDIYNNWAWGPGGGICLVDHSVFFLYGEDEGGEARYGSRDYTVRLRVTGNDIYDNVAFSWNGYFRSYPGERKSLDTKAKKVLQNNNYQITDLQQSWLDNYEVMMQNFERNARLDSVSSLMTTGGGGIYSAFKDVELINNTIDHNITFGWWDYYFFYEGPFGRDLDAPMNANGCGAGVCLQGVALYPDDLYGGNEGRSLPPYYPILTNNDILNNRIEIIVPDFHLWLRNGEERIWEQFGSYATAMGAGVFSMDCYPIMTGNDITGNEIVIPDTLTDWYWGWYRERFKDLDEDAVSPTQISRESDYFPPISFGGGICQIVTSIDSSLIDSTMLMRGNTIEMTDNTVSDNHSFFGAGVALLGMNKAQLVDNTIDNNSTNVLYYYGPGDPMIDGIGGGIFNEGILNISGGSVSNNIAGMAGGIFEDLYMPYWFGERQGFTPLTVADCNISNNTTTWGAGGGVCITSFWEPWPWWWIYNYYDYWEWYDFGGGREDRVYGDIIFRDCTIDSNFADNRGGGINISGTNNVDVFIDGGSISYNTAYNGGGLQCFDQDLFVYDVDFIGNSAPYSDEDSEGGAMFLRDCNYFEIINSKFLDNYADDDGGAVLIEGDWDDRVSEARDSGFLIANCLFADNVSDDDGGGIEFNDAYGEFFNNTVANNYADDHGGGISIYDSDIDIVNTIIWGNEAGDHDPQIYYSGGGRGDSEDSEEAAPEIRWYDLDNCIVEDYRYNGQMDERWLSTFSVIDFDPMFIDSTDYHLADNSPAINTGTPDTVGLDLPDIDLDGNPRIYNGYMPRIDIGCYEFQGDPRIQYIFDGFREDVTLCADSIYVYTDPEIPPDVSVIICPGTVVMHMEPMYRDGGRDPAYGFGWFIEGCLFAVGTETNRITFTAQYPLDPGWSGLYFINSDNDFFPSRLKYCDVEYVNTWYTDWLPYWGYFWWFDQDFDFFGAAVTLIDYSNIRISETTFRYNHGVLGGGIGVHGESYPYIQDNLFHENFALGGGGIFYSPDFFFAYGGLREDDRPLVIDSTFVVANNTFENNWAVSGGGLYLQQHLDAFYDREDFDADLTVEVHDNTFTNNISVGNLIAEEAIFLLDSLEVYTDGFLQYLPFLYREMDVVSAYQELFSDSRFQIWSGGGGIFSGNLSPDIYDNEFTGNGALGFYDEEHYGDAEYGEYNYPFPTNNFFASRGGGIFTALDPIYYFVAGDREFGIPNTDIHNNLIEDNFTYSITDVSYIDSLVYDWGPIYVSVGSGAGVYNAYQYLDLRENEILNNNVIVDEFDYERYIQSQEEDRSYTFGYAGGGVYHLEPEGYYPGRDGLNTTLIQSNVIDGNSALYGGGIAIDSPGIPMFYNRESIPDYVVKIHNNLITNNSANWDWVLIDSLVGPGQYFSPPGGGGVYMGPSVVATLINNTVADNQAFTGGGLLNTYSDLYILNNIFWGNEADWGSGEFYPDQFYLYSFFPEVYYNDIQNGYDELDRSFSNDEERDWYTDAGNIDADPVFAGTGLHPYMLFDNTPCANAGDPNTNLDSLFLPEFDLRGADRIYMGDIIDMGAYETGNNPPYDIILGEPASVPENEDPGYFVGLLSTLDLDELDTHTYTLVEDTSFVALDNDCFEIIGDSLFTTCMFNFEDLLGARGTADKLTSEFSTNSAKERPALPNAWINELHYDNSGADTGEFVEIVMEYDPIWDLSLFTLTLYNGSSSVRAPYDSETLDNFVVGSSYDAYVFFTWYRPGIQNGAPDGLSLDYDGYVIQFLSYEGSFEAASGPAEGLTSTDMDVSESGGTQEGESLQLIDITTRSLYGDYVWASPMNETPGMINTDQTLDLPHEGVYVRIRTTDDGEYNMYYEETIFIPVIDMNDDPIMDLPDEYAFDEDTSIGPFDFDAFISDEDVDFTRVPNNLTLEVTGNDSIIVEIVGLEVTFSAVEDWFGEETLTFTVYDGWARAFASDDVLIIVEPVDDPPEIEIPPGHLELLFISDEDTPFVVDFGPYISQAYGETDDVVLIVADQFSTSVPNMDDLIIDITGFVVTFTPLAHQFGTMDVQFEVYDVVMRSTGDKDIGFNKARSKVDILSTGINNTRNGNMVMVEVTILEVNDPPLFDVPITLEAIEDDPSEEYDFEPYTGQTWGEDDSLSLSAVGSAHIDVMVDGFIVVIESNTLNWFGGPEDITFTLSDNVTRLETVVLVPAIIYPYNDAPVLDFIEDVVMLEDTTHDLTASATDVDNLPEELIYSAYVQSGNLSVSVVDDVVTITPDPDWYGMGSIVVKVFDGLHYDQQLVNVEVINVNDTPYLNLPAFFSFQEGDELVVDMAQYLSDADILRDVYTITADPAEFIIIEIDELEVTFSAVADWNGTENVTFTIDDNVARGAERADITMNATTRASSSSSVDIIVTYDNDAPYVIDPIGDITIAEDDPPTVIADLNAVFDDVDLIYGDALTFTYDVGFYTGITVEIAADVVTITPDENWNGIFPVTFIATDSYGETAEDYVEITVTPENDPPVFDLPDELSFHEDGVLVTNFLQYVEDIDGDELTLTIGATTNINIEQSLWALVFSTVEPNWTGEEMITFTVDDGVERVTVSDDVNIVVIPQNDPPFYLEPLLVQVTEDFGTYTIGDLDDMFDDVEDDALTFTLDYFNPLMLTAEIDVDNNLIIESVDNACGNTSVVVIASDGEYDVPQAIAIDILAENDPPELVNLPEHIEMGAYSNMILNLDDCWLDVDDVPTMAIMPADNFITVTQLPGYDYRFRLDALLISGMEDIITVILSDGQAEVMEDILVTVADSEAPIITFLIPNLEYLEDFALTEVVDLDQCFEDPEGMPLTFGAYEVGDGGFLEVVVDEDNILSIGSGTQDWFGSVCVDVWANDASTRTQTTQTVQIDVLPVNDAPYIIGEIDDVVLAEDFGTYTVADLTTIFADVDGPNMMYIPLVTSGDAVTAGIEGTDLMLYSVDNVWGEAEVRIIAEDTFGARSSVWIDFAVTVAAVYDTPTFDPALDGEMFYIEMDGEIIDFSPWVETYGQENSIPMNMVLLGDIPYYIVENVDGMIYGMFAYTIGHQWAFPDQDCQLWLDGGSNVTITLVTDLPDAPPLSGGTITLQSGEKLRIDLQKEFDSQKVFLLQNAHSDAVGLVSNELILGKEVNVLTEEDITINVEDRESGLIQQLTYKLIIEPRGEDTPVYITELHGNHPNPFNPETTINFSIGEPGRAVITIYNIKGEKVRTITDEVYEPGIYNAHWNGKDELGNPVSSGIYFYTLECGSTSKIKKMMLLQ